MSRPLIWPLLTEEARTRMPVRGRDGDGRAPVAAGDRMREGPSSNASNRGGRVGEYDRAVSPSRASQSPNQKRPNAADQMYGMISDDGNTSQRKPIVGRGQGSGPARGRGPARPMTSPGRGGSQGRGGPRGMADNRGSGRGSGGGGGYERQGRGGRGRGGRGGQGRGRTSGMAGGAGRAGKPFDYEINDETFELNDKEDSKLLENWEKMDTHELKEVSPATSRQTQSLSRVQMTTGHLLCCHLRCQCFRER